MVFVASVGVGSVVLHCVCFGPSLVQVVYCHGVGVVFCLGVLGVLGVFCLL
jgi:hypothetical protein